MPRELRISAVVTLPDDMFDEAATLVAAKPILTTLREKFPDARVEYDVVSPKPRSAKTEGEST